MSLDKHLENVIKETENNAKRTGFIGKLLESATPFLVFINIPLAVTVGVTGLALDTLQKKKNLKDTMMPDSWLKEVAASTTISDNGLAFLRDKMGDKNSVSVADALVFLEIEYEHEKSLKLVKPSVEIKEEPLSGAKALKARFSKIKENEEVKIKPQRIKQFYNEVIDLSPKAINLLMLLKGKKK